MDNQHKHHHISLVGPSFLIGIGIILLLDNLGYLKWNIWELVRLWPLFLIVLGLELLLQGRQFGRIISAIVVLILLLGGVWFMSKGSDPRSSTTISHLKNDTSSFVVNLQPAIGDITIDGYKDSANLVGGEIVVPRGIRVDENFSAGNRARLRLSTLPSSRNWWPGKHESWNLELNPDALLDMELDLGIGDVDLNLSTLNVNKVNTDFGIGIVKIQLPASGNYDVYVDGGIGSIILEIPYDLGVTITTDSGIATRDLPSEYTRMDNVWISPDYDEKENRANIYLSVGIGTILVKRVPGM